MSFKTFVNKNKIYEFEKFEREKLKNLHEGLICEHINTLCDLHGRLKGCSFPVQNLINKMYEDFKVSELILKQDIERYRFNPKNEFENKISSLGEDFLYRIRNIIDKIKENNYESLIVRSMKSREICAYNVYIYDFYSLGSKIYVRKIGDFCENILEYDYVKFMVRLKRSGRDVDFRRVCSYICSKEDFNIDSYNFMMACVSFPYEFMRVISKYRDVGRSLSDYHLNCDFEEILRKDGESLI